MYAHSQKPGDSVYSPSHTGLLHDKTQENRRSGSGRGVSVYRYLPRALVCMIALVVAAPVAADGAFSPLTFPQSPPKYILANFPVHAQWWGLSCEYAATS